MTTHLRRIAWLAVMAALGGCSFDAFTYTVDRYGTVKERLVRLGCNDAYEVFDRPDAGALLVVTNGANETLSGLCGGSAELPKPERMRRVARLFLNETSDRPTCQITRETDVTPVHTEFNYRCPAPRPPRTAKS